MDYWFRKHQESQRVEKEHLVVAKKKSGGARKHGRGKDKGAKYRALKKHEKSHIKRIEKHMKTYKDTSPMPRIALEKYQNLTASSKYQGISKV